MLGKIAACITCVMVATPAAALWGREGHAIIADLAWRELSPETQSAITALLEGAEHGTTIQETASWADAVRPLDGYSWSGPLHYVNMPVGASSYEHARDCPDVGCVVSAVQRFRDEVRDTSLPIETRREALMFLVHFVGDMHQPLHGGRGEDRGGNDIDVVFFGRETNLHRIWDFSILEAHDASPWPVKSERLHAAITDNDRIAWLADFHDEDMIATSGRWAYESHMLAEEYAYGLVENGDALSVNYVDATVGVSELRLMQGGVRLAAVLETAFEPVAEVVDASQDVEADALSE
ncbi:MAG: S1/P1 nuclease [Planctomycetota bacterium]